LKEETAEYLTILQAENKREVIARRHLESLKATGRSLMPEGMEKEITPAEMADLLAFLKHLH
jgi:hypothetical protein